MDEETQNNEKNEHINLGDRIKLVGFKQTQPGSVIIAKKIVGNYVKKLEDSLGKLDEITIYTKPVHGDTNDKAEVKVKAIKNGKVFTSEMTDFNMFVTMSKVFDKLFNEIEHDNKE